MDIRIGIEKHGEAVEIRIDGRLAGSGVEELLREIQEHGQPTRVVLNDLRSADQSGLEVLREWRQAGVELVGASPYIQQLLTLPVTRQQSEIEDESGPSAFGKLQ